MPKTVTKPKVLQDGFLEVLSKNHEPVSVFLINGIKLQGHIENYDQFVILLRNQENAQIIYKHAISTVVPVRAMSDFGR